jgi:hypothetical protein
MDPVLKLVFKKYDGGGGVNSIDLAKDKAGCCESGNGTAGSIKCG